MLIKISYYHSELFLVKILLIHLFIYDGNMSDFDLLIKTKQKTVLCDSLLNRKPATPAIQHHPPRLFSSNISTGMGRLSSSAISRQRQCSGVSPGLILPPGNSHFKGMAMVRLRRAANTQLSCSMMAQVTCRCLSLMS